VRAIVCRSVIIGLLAGTLAGAIAGSAAAARWPRPFALGHSGVLGFDEHFASIATAADGEGGIVIAWPGVRTLGRQAVDLAVRLADGSFVRTRSVDLARGTVGGPRVAMGASGAAA
jgi:hypothetical protein